MQSSTRTRFALTRFRRICGRVLSAENCQIDEQRNAVHGECYSARNRVNDAASSAQEKPKTMQSFRLWLTRLAATW